jgi:hypothetical protein
MEPPLPTVPRATPLPTATVTMQAAIAVRRFLRASRCTSAFMSFLLSG